MGFSISSRLWERRPDSDDNRVERHNSGVWCSQQKSSWYGKALESLPHTTRGQAKTTEHWVLGCCLLDEVQLWYRGALSRNHDSWLPSLSFHFRYCEARRFQARWITLVTASSLCRAAFPRSVALWPALSVSCQSIISSGGTFTTVHRRDNILAYCISLDRGSLFWASQSLPQALGEQSKKLQTLQWCEKMPSFQKSRHFASKDAAVRFFKACLVIFMGGGLGEQTNYIGVWPSLNTQEKNLDQTLVKLSMPNQFIGLYSIVKAPRAAFFPLPAGFPFSPHQGRARSHHSCHPFSLLPLLCSLNCFYHELSLKFWCVRPERPIQMAKCHTIPWAQATVPDAAPENTVSYIQFTGGEKKKLRLFINFLQLITSAFPTTDTGPTSINRGFSYRAYFIKASEN